MIIDNEMTFNTESKRYYLTENYVYNKLGTDLSLVAFDELDTNLGTIKGRIIEYACDMVYDFIENNAVSPQSTLYDFTQRQESHNALKKALGYQLLDFIQNGDISMEKGNKVSETVNNRAIQALLAKDCFNIVRRVPSNVEAW